MTLDPPSAAKEPRLDDLLAMMGITREQMIGMTADDLFAAATRWQEAATTATAQAQPVVSPVDRLLNSLHGNRRVRPG